MPEKTTAEDNRLKAIDYDVTWAASEKESILAAWDALQRSKDEKVD